MLPRGAALLAPCAGTVAVHGGTSPAADDGVEIALWPHGAIGCGAATRLQLPPGRAPIVATGERVAVGQTLTDGHRDPHVLLALAGRAATEEYLVGEIAGIYRAQGVALDPRHIELIVGRMTRWAMVEDGGDTTLLQGELVALADLMAADATAVAAGGRPATARATLLGVTRAALASDSFLAAAGFQETTDVLADAALARRVDRLRSLKANVLLGRRIPAGTGFAEPFPMPPVRLGGRTGRM